MMHFWLHFHGPLGLPNIQIVHFFCTGYSLSGQYIFSPINPKYNVWFSRIYEDLHKLFWNSKLAKLMLFNVRTICANLRKNHTTISRILGQLVTFYRSKVILDCTVGTNNFGWVQCVLVGSKSFWTFPNIFQKINLDLSKTICTRPIQIGPL